MGLFNILSNTSKSTAKKGTAKQSGPKATQIKKQIGDKNHFTGNYSRKTRVPCYECGGSGVVECDCTGGCGPRAADDDCYACGGTGFHTCPVCRGHKWVYEE